MFWREVQYTDSLEYPLPLNTFSMESVLKIIISFEQHVTTCQLFALVVVTRCVRKSVLPWGRNLQGRINDVTSLFFIVREARQWTKKRPCCGLSRLNP